MKLMEQVRQQMSLANYEKNTIRVYVRWIVRYIHYYGLKHPAKLGPPAIVQFLAYQANERKMSASSINQALDALRYLYNEVIGVPVDDALGRHRARLGRHLPEVAGRVVIGQVLAGLPEKYHLLGLLVYGSGLSIGQAVKLRVGQVDLERRAITIGKRQTVIAEKAAGLLAAQISLANVWPANVAGYVFPSSKIHNGRCWHISPTSLEKAMKVVTKRLQLGQRVTPRVLRNSFILHLLEDGYNVRTVQEIAGLANVKQVMVYKRMLDVRHVVSPLDELEGNNIKKKSRY